MSSNQNLKNRLAKAQSGVQKPSYKRLYLNGKGKEFKLRLLSTEHNDVEATPFFKVDLHGGYKHPNYEQEYSSNFRCPKKTCPMCSDYFDTLKREKGFDKSNRTAWKKEVRRYSMYWAINRENNELTLVYVPDIRKIKNKDGTWQERGSTLQSILYNKLMSAADQGMDPFSLKDGNDIIIKSRAIDGKAQYDVYIENEKNSVDEKTIQKLKTLPALRDVMQTYSIEDLKKIVSGEKITSKKQDDDKEVKVKQESIKTDISNFSEEDLSPEDVSNFELSDDDKLLSDELPEFSDSDDEPVSKSNSISEKLRNLKFSDDKE